MRSSRYQLLTFACVLVADVMCVYEPKIARSSGEGGFYVAKGR